MRNVCFELCKVFKLQMSKHVWRGLEGESKIQGSDVRHIVPEETLDDLERGRFAAMSNHFDYLDRCRSAIFAFH